MKAYVYIIEGKVVINPEKKPEKPPFHRYHNFVLWHNKDLKEWESNCIEVENALYSDAYEDGVAISGGAGIALKFTPGSQVEHDGPVITKII